MKDALKRIITPEYRVVLEMKEHGTIYIERRTLWGDWQELKWLRDRMEFDTCNHAYAYIDNLHEIRKYNVHLLAKWETE